MLLPEGGACVESTGVGDGNCYFVDSKLSNNWRQLRIVGGDDGVDMSYVEYDPTWAFNDTAAMQHYELCGALLCLCCIHVLSSEPEMR